MIFPNDFTKHSFPRSYPVIERKVTLENLEKKVKEKIITFSNRGILIQDPNNRKQDYYKKGTPEYEKIIKEVNTENYY